MKNIKFNLYAPTVSQLDALQRFRPFTEDEIMISGMPYGLRAYDGIRDLFTHNYSSGRCMHSNAPAYYHYVAVVRDFNTAFNAVTYEVYLYTYESADDAVIERGIKALDDDHLTPSHVSRWCLTVDLNYDNKLRDALYQMFITSACAERNLLSFYHDDHGAGYRLADAVSEITDTIVRANYSMERVRRICEIDRRLDNLINKLFKNSTAGGTYGVEDGVFVNTDLKVLHVYEVYRRNF